MVAGYSFKTAYATKHKKTWDILFTLLALCITLPTRFSPCSLSSLA